MRAETHRGRLHGKKAIFLGRMQLFLMGFREGIGGNTPSISQWSSTVAPLDTGTSEDFLTWQFPWAGSKVSKDGEHFLRDKRKTSGVSKDCSVSPSPPRGTVAADSSLLSGISTYPGLLETVFLLVFLFINK